MTRLDMTDPAQALNQACYCRTLNPGWLRQQLEADASLQGLDQDIAQTRPHLFSSTAVFMSPQVAEQIAQSVLALERVMALAPYQQAALERAPAIAQQRFGPAGVFMGYDFHITEQGPRLIEVNTNAGGAMLNAALARAQQACCQAVDEVFKPNPALLQLENTFFDMFMIEWRSQRGDTPLRSIAIVDDTPDTQYLAPEFALFRQMLQQRGLQAHIVDAAAFEWQAGQLHHAGHPVDMVYNRLTDFYLSEPSHQALRQAYEAGAVVLTPHPHAHAVHADKRNLVALSDAAQLAQWGVSQADRHLLAMVVPHTVLVTPESAEALWTQRRQWFFKPMGGFGAKGAYRGDKLTRRVWSDILGGDFVAQALVPPGGRAVSVDGVSTALKFDVRAYTYAGQVQLMAARMYSGQTTNFRTPGGGFAPIIVMP